MVQNKKLILMVGVPGAGKSTYVQKLKSENPSSLIISPDSIRGELTGDESDQSQNYKVFKIALARLDTAMRNGISTIIWDATCYNKKNRKEPISIAKQHGYTVEACVKKVSLETALKQNKMRNRQVPDEVIERQLSGWQDPETSEGIDNIVNI